jgi:hypothetical protein
MIAESVILSEAKNLFAGPARIQPASFTTGVETLRCAQGDKYGEARELEDRSGENVASLLE